MTYDEFIEMSLVVRILCFILLVKVRGLFYKRNIIDFF